MINLFNFDINSNNNMCPICNELFVVVCTDQKHSYNLLYSNISFYENSKTIEIRLGLKNNILYYGIYLDYNFLYCTREIDSIKDIYIIRDKILNNMIFT